MGSSQRTAQRLSAGYWTEAAVRETPACSECQDACWASAVTVYGHGGEDGYRSVLFWRDHQSQGHAHVALGRWLSGHGGLMVRADNERWLLEHQLKLL